MTEEDIEAVVQVLRGDWLTGGPAVKAFENALANRTDASYAVACASGTAALHLGCIVLGLGAGNCAVVPSVTFLATANSVILAGADVVFADVDSVTGLMTEETLEAALARAPSPVGAILPVHLNGQFDCSAALACRAKEVGAAVIADACHALGSFEVDDAGGWMPVGNGSHAELTAFSFHAVKTVAMGEGGALTTNNADLAARVRRLRNHGMSRSLDRFMHTDMACGSDAAANPWYYEMDEVGFNYRVSDIQCALGLSQLGRLDEIRTERQRLVELYDTALAPLAPNVRPVGRARDSRPLWHLYPVLIDYSAIGLDRGTVIQALKKHGIGTQVHYIPVHQQPYYVARYGRIELPGADAYYARCLSLPLYSGMREEQVDTVVDALRQLATR